MPGWGDDRTESLATWASKAPAVPSTAGESRGPYGRLRRRWRSQSDHPNVSRCAVARAVLTPLPVPGNLHSRPRNLQRQYEAGSRAMESLQGGLSKNYGLCRSRVEACRPGQGFRASRQDPLCQERSPTGDDIWDRDLHKRTGLRALWLCEVPRKTLG